MSLSHTIIEVTENGLKISSIDNSGLFISNELIFSSNIELLKKEQIITFLSTIKIEDSVFLVVNGDKNCLIPVTVFDNSKPSILFNFTFGVDSKNVDFCRIPSLSVVNIYEIPLWIKSFFVLRFPTLVLLHESTAIIKILSNYKGLNTRIVLNLQDTFYSLNIYHLGNVVFQNSFVTLENSDVLYYTLHSLKQLNLAGRKANLIVSASNAAGNEKAKKLIEEFKKINDFSQLQIEMKENFIAQNIQLCE